MLLTGELLETVKQLSKPDKQNLVRILLSDLSEDNDILPETDRAYPIWSQYNAFEAAETLLKALETEKPV